MNYIFPEKHISIIEEILASFLRQHNVDEKTGIQALERIHDKKPMKQGLPESIEFEYKRHGTLCLTPSFNILTGKIDYHTIAETRNESDFADHIKNTVSLAPEASWIFVSDQLNTHKSESLVRFISEACELKDDLGVKGKSGILQSMDSRMEFLSNEAHRIRFVYTPKHCSWLNQVEIWFGILSRKMLKRGSFKSKDEFLFIITILLSSKNYTSYTPFLQLDKETISKYMFRLWKCLNSDIF